MLGRRIFIHIGTHKTGTTSIQSLLLQRAMRLEEQGIYVPETGRPQPQTGPQTSGHHNLAWALYGDPRARPAFGDIDDLVKELAQVPFQKAVISAEDFEFLVSRPEILRKMGHTFVNAGWQPHYIVFLRDPASYVISLYNQILKRHPNVVFTQYIDMILKEGYYQREQDSGKCFYFDYEAFISLWRAATEGPVDIYSYTAASRGAGVVETFLSAIGIKDVRAIMRQARTPRSMWKQMLGRLRADNDTSDFRLNTGTKLVTDDMRALASRVEDVYRPSFERITAPRKA